jgi:hypothetical protein
MKFGYLLASYNPPELSQIPDADLYAAMFERIAIAYAEEIGLKTIWTTEHHCLR